MKKNMIVKGKHSDYYYLHGAGKTKLLNFKGATVEENWVVVEHDSPAYKEVSRNWNPPSHGYRAYCEQTNVENSNRL